MAYKYKIIIAVFAAALITGAGIWFWRAGPDEIAFPQFDLSSLFAGQEPDSETLNSETSETLKLSNVYTNPDYGFSLQYQEGFKITEFEEETGRVILVGDKFQIFITSFDEPGLITAERISRDLDIHIESPDYISVGGLQALSFKSNDESLGKTREIWFSHNGYLYQVSALADFDETLFQILKTWKFQ